MIQEPDNTDAILGGTIPPPMQSLALGGIEGLRQRFAIASAPQKLELIPQALNYGEAGIDLLIDSLNDERMSVRGTAYQLLKKSNSERAKSAIQNGLRLEMGDRLYCMYESKICFNDWCYDLLSSVEEIEINYGRAVPTSHHFSIESAELAAHHLHQWRAFQDETCEFLTRIGWNEFRGLRSNFDLVDWCWQNNVLIRLPGESRFLFEKRLEKSGYDIYDSSKLYDEHIYILEELDREDFDEGEPDAGGLGISHSWNLRLRQKLEQRTINLLRAEQQYELLPQLWLEAVGSLAFVDEMIIEEQTYLDIQ